MTPRGSVWNSRRDDTRKKSRDRSCTTHSDPASAHLLLTFSAPVLAPRGGSALTRHAFPRAHPYGNVVHVLHQSAGGSTSRLTGSYAVTPPLRQLHITGMYNTGTNFAFVTLSQCRDPDASSGAAERRRNS